MSWNKVENGLPTKDADYFLVHGGNTDHIFAGYYTEECGFSDNHDSYDPGEITHWMEIPKL